MTRFRIRSDRVLLSPASRSTIEGYFDSRQTPDREQRWLDQNNRYRLSATQTFEKDQKRATANQNPLSKQKCKLLTAYIGASAPTHLIDGWSFLGRAVDSLLRGDTYSAAHFGYYAELRAAMGLLGSEGIGIFNQIHPVVTLNGINRFPAGKKKVGTHAVIWPILKYWASLNRASDLFDIVIQPNQVRLSSWLGALSPNLSTKAVGQRWLRSWGLDLENLEDDHDTRNLVSYRPSEFRTTVPAGSKHLISFVQALWGLFEPGQGGRFPTVEGYLLRNAWRNGGAPAVPPNAIESLGIGPEDSADWARFLGEAGDPTPIALADNSTGIEEPNCHLRIISRAALLLFVASGAARVQLQRAGFTSETISFWWRAIWCRSWPVESRRKPG
jgi:hypothetical protein